jgi:hypothetical protein
VNCWFERRSRMQMRLRVEADDESLELLRTIAREDPGGELRVQEITRMEPGVMNEPILTGLVLVGLARVTAGAIARWMKHRERMAEIRNVRLQILVDGRARDVSMEDLLKLADASA